MEQTMRLMFSLFCVMILSLLPGLSQAQKPPKQETPYAAALAGWRAGKQFVYLTREDVPQGKTNQLPSNLHTEEEIRAYFETNHKAVAWADAKMNVVVLNTEDPRGYSRVLLIEGADAGKIGWIA